MYSFEHYFPKLLDILKSYNNIELIANHLIPRQFLSNVFEYRNTD